MRRLQLVEIEDLAWCPAAVRDGGTDWLAFMANLTGVFVAVAPKIRTAMTAAGTDRVLDLGSGGGGPWLTLEPELSTSGPVTVELSDLHPNAKALGAVCERGGGRLRWHSMPVDATNVPADLEGVRTLFSAFHHYPPDRAEAVLADAVAKGRGVCVFEGVSHRAIGLLSVPLQVPAMMLMTPFVRPFRWSRLVFTYLIPLIPLVVLFDGIVSMLRLYSEDELRELVERVSGHERYEWHIGSVAVAGWSIGPLYLVGFPTRR